ncbi:MAG: hypothetical protein RLN85_01975, partial [Pseudomonadales bacterium]
AFAYKTPEVLIAFTASAVAGLVHAGFSAVFIVPASMLVGFLLLTVFWALSLPNGRPAESPSKQATPCACGNGLVIFLAVAIVTGGLVWMNQVWRYHEAMVVDLSQYQERPNAAYWPRFWFHGNFPRPEN